MTFKRLMPLLLYVCCLTALLHAVVLAQPYPQWGRIEPGQYGVGHRVVLSTDYTRTFNQNTENRGRPLQFNIWYPAVKNDSMARMPYVEYVGWIGLIGRKGPLDDEIRNAGKSEFYRYFMSKGVPKEKLDLLLKMPTAVGRNAVEERGPFPVVLFAPGIGESPIMHTILCEVLASHGYLVLAIPSMGWSSREMRFTGSCVEAQMRDLEQAIAWLRDDPHADIRRLGIVGFSLGSCAAILLPMRNTEISAVASLDGSIGFRDRLSLVKSSPFFDPSVFTVPLLHVNVKGNKRNDTAVIDSMKHSMRYIVGIKGITHINFTSLGMIAGIVPGFWKSVERNALPGYETICRYTLDFLNVHVKREKKKANVLTESAQPTAGPAGFITVKIEKPVSTSVR